MAKKFDLLTFILAFFLLDKLVSAKGVGNKILWTLLKIITAGGIGIWYIVDIVMLILGKYQVNPLKYFK